MTYRRSISFCISLYIEYWNSIKKKVLLRWYAYETQTNAILNIARCNFNLYWCMGGIDLAEIKKWPNHLRFCEKLIIKRQPQALKWQVRSVKGAEHVNKPLTSFDNNTFHTFCLVRKGQNNKQSLNQGIIEGARVVWSIIRHAVF